MRGYIINEPMQRSNLGNGALCLGVDALFHYNLNARHVLPAPACMYGATYARAIMREHPPREAITCLACMWLWGGVW